MRINFDYSCECGYWYCPCCSYPFYPMEIDPENEQCDICGDNLVFMPHEAYLRRAALAETLSDEAILEFFYGDVLT